MVICFDLSVEILERQLVRQLRTSYFSLWGVAQNNFPVQKQFPSTGCHARSCMCDIQTTHCDYLPLIFRCIAQGLWWKCVCIYCSSAMPYGTRPLSTSPFYQIWGGDTTFLLVGFKFPSQIKTSELGVSFIETIRPRSHLLQNVALDPLF